MSILTVDDIHTYYGQSHVLHGVSLDVAEGESVALLGRNGAGKTTTLRSIIGMTPPREGRIEFKGERVDGMEPYQIARRGIGLVPEERRVFPELSVDDNIEVVMTEGGEWDRERVYDVFPALREHRTQLAGQLSGGQQQMLTIARALVTDPDLLLLDEPSAGLAPTLVSETFDHLQRLKEEGIDMVIVEQNVREVLDIAEHVFLLDQGRLEFSGPPAELADEDELVEMYLGDRTV
jgi:branched-chain amino acid transport system ATP-binding protein